jgi:intermediate cleaving peptidase 55
MGILFPHHLGHYIGLDVHDCPGYSRGYSLKAGQCITIEPYVQELNPLLLPYFMLTQASGIYVPDSGRWPEKFRGIGIRIEDSVCVGDDSPIVLTTEAVKEVGTLALFSLISASSFQSDDWGHTSPMSNMLTTRVPRLTILRLFEDRMDMAVDKIDTHCI